MTLLKKWLVTTVLLVAVIFIVAANLPASLLPRLIEHSRQQNILPQTFPPINFSALTGTLWQGQGDVIVIIDDVAVDLDVVSWQLSALSLLSLQVHLTVLSQGDEHQLAGKVVAFPGGDVHITHAEGFFPMSELEPWVPMLVNGQIYFQFNKWQFTQQMLNQLEGVINLEYIDWVGGDYPLPLGNYVADVSVNQHDIRITLSDSEALLGVDGLITVAPNGDYRFNATLYPRSGLAPEVSETIVFLGKRSADGSVIINQRGRL